MSDQMREVVPPDLLTLAELEATTKAGIASWSDATDGGDERDYVARAVLDACSARAAHIFSVVWPALARQPAEHSISDLVAERDALRHAVSCLMREADSLAATPAAPVAPAPEIRRNDDGSLDEVVGTGDFHLEQMSATHWWMALEYPGGRVVVNLLSKATIKAHAEHEGTTRRAAAPAQVDEREALRTEIEAWKTRFPAYVYRPQDECVALIGPAR